MASVVRVVVVAVVCVAFGTLLVADGRSLSTREVLLRESETLLPPEARVLSREYHERCLEFLGLESPPCLLVRFLPSGPANRSADAVLGRAEDRWSVARKHRDRDGWQLRFFRAGQLRAHATIRTRESRTRCQSPYLGPLSCADSLVVEFGPPAVIPKFAFDPNVTLPPGSAALLDRMRERRLATPTP
jgi:hypothetical protein